MESSWLVGWLTLGGALLLAGVLVRAFSRKGPARSANSPSPPPSTRPGQVKGASFTHTPVVDAGEDEDVTEKTLAVTGSRPFLMPVEGPAASKERFFLSSTGITTIGRSGKNDIVLTEEAVSAEHCRIEKQGNAYVLTDRASTNRTWVNGVEKSQVVLRNGDKIKIGDTTMVFALFGERTSQQTLRGLTRPGQRSPQ